MIQKIKEKTEKIKEKALLLIVSAQTAILTTSPVYADKISDKAEEASESVFSSMQGLGKPLLLVALGAACLIFIIGTREQRDTAKNRVLLTVIGVAGLVVGVMVVEVVWGWFE